jgi:3-polyprenyl-4-hydroxybenzoate decarboxylase
VYSITLTDANSYTIDITGTLGSYGSSSISFTLTVTNPCLSVTLSTTAVGSQTYTIGDSLETITFDAFTASVSGSLCGTITYAATETSPTAGSLPGFITYPYTTDYEFSVYSTDITQANTYTIEITGTLASYTSTSITFTLTVVNPCLSVTLATTAVGS